MGKRHAFFSLLPLPRRFDDTHDDDYFRWGNTTLFAIFALRFSRYFSPLMPPPLMPFHASLAFLR